MAPHERVFVDEELFDDENHGDIACQDCHGGNPDDPNFKTAHEGVVRDPSYPAAGVCADCHEQQAETFPKTLHATNRGMKLPIDVRVNPDPQVKAGVDRGFSQSCTGCHASCGQCHIARPASVGGGLLSGHIYNKTPPMRQTCTACHGTRVGDEFLGLNKPYKPDIHRQMAFMKCNKCHTAEHMHGDGTQYDHRYDVENGPTCKGCHEDIYTEKGENRETHDQHKDRVSCHVCHSQPYMNCFACHAGKTKDGQKFFEVQSHGFDFKVGINPRRSERRPERFVTVRHVPVYPDSFKFYTADGLTNFDRLPTWTLATPHNIRRKTEQNSACNNCHGNKKLFLLESEVKPEYRRANRGVIVKTEMVPKKIDDPPPAKK